MIDIDSQDWKGGCNELRNENASSVWENKCVLADSSDDDEISHRGVWCCSPP